MSLYIYRAHAVRVIDGDTFEAEIDLGLRIFTRAIVRLYGVNTPELRDKIEANRTAAFVMRQKLHDLLYDYSPSGQPGNRDWPLPLILCTHKDRTEKYGRWLGVVYHNDSFKTTDEIIKGQSINLTMLQAVEDLAKVHNLISD